MATDAGTDPSNPTPPPPPPPSPDDDHLVGQLRRRPDRGPLGGVCAGIAEHFGIDVTFVRIAAVILACLGPGIPAYVVGWIFLPEADGTTVAPRFGRPERDDSTTQVVGIGLIIVALSFLWGDWWIFGRGWFLPVALIGLGAWLLARSAQDDDAAPGAPAAPRPPGPPAPPNAPVALATPTAGVDSRVDGADATEVAEATGATEAPIDDPLGPDPDGRDDTAAGGEPPDGGSDTEVTAVPEPPSPPAAPSERRRGRFLGPLVFGVLLLWAGVAWLAGVDAQDALAVGLCLVGAGFVVGAFVGGSKALVAPALLIAGALAFVSVVDIPLEGGIGDRTWTVSQISDLEDDYELAIGEATLDLRDLDLTDGSADVSVQVGIGHLEVIVPDGVEVDVRADVGAGELQVLGHRDEGMGIDFDRRIAGDPELGTLELDLDVGLGKIDVTDARPHRPARPSPPSVPR